MNTQALLSLYDYLGHAAGSELGKRVNNFAMSRNEENETRDVKTQSYEGKIQLYRREFLDEFFAANPQDR